MQKTTIFSGIQPSGDLHIGNLIGAIQQWVGLQSKENELIFCIVDLHAITVPQNSKVLREKILELAALYIACGIDPAKSKIFVQSENPDHPYLAWIFDCITPMGWMNRMTQFKEKSRKEGESTSVGLFHYPNLMASDILLYDTDLVPVGEDQVQHIELTRDIAARFNKRFGEAFKLPKVQIDREAARIMSLQQPDSKMSKSAKDPLGTVNLLDSASEIRRKVERAVTDSGKEIRYDPVKKPGVSNLLVIYSTMSHQSIKELEERYRGAEYTAFKKDLAEVMVERLSTIQKKYKEFRADEIQLKAVLADGLATSRARSRRKVEKVKRLVGLGLSTASGSEAGI